MLGKVDDIVPMDSRDFRYRYSPLRLLLAGIDRSTLPKELVGPLCGFAKMKVYLSRLIRCSAGCAMIKCFFVTDNST